MKQVPWSVKAKSLDCLLIVLKHSGALSWSATMGVRVHLDLHGYVQYISRVERAK